MEDIMSKPMPAPSPYELPDSDVEKWLDQHAGRLREEACAILRELNERGVQWHHYRDRPLTIPPGIEQLLQGPVYTATQAAVYLVVTLASNYLSPRRGTPLAIPPESERRALAREVAFEAVQVARTAPPTADRPEKRLERLLLEGLNQLGQFDIPAAMAAGVVAGEAAIAREVETALTLTDGERSRKASRTATERVLPPTSDATKESEEQTPMEKVFGYYFAHQHESPTQEKLAVRRISSRSSDSNRGDRYTICSLPGGIGPFQPFTPICGTKNQTLRSRRR
jgi:hypothetical protein